MNINYFLAGYSLVIAIWLWFIGLRGLVAKKPLLIPAWWSFWVISLPAFSLVAVTMATEVSVPRWGLGSLFAVFIVGLWFVRGYEAYGVTNASLREGLLASLKKLNLTYEETPKGLRLPQIGAELQVTNTRRGVSRVNMKQRHFRSVMRNIAKGMNEYYQSGTAVETNMNCFIRHLAVGILFLLVGAVFFLIGSIGIGPPAMP